MEAHKLDNAPRVRFHASPFGEAWKRPGKPNGNGKPEDQVGRPRGEIGTPMVPRANAPKCYFVSRPSEPVTAPLEQRGKGKPISIYMADHIGTPWQTDA